MKSRILWKLVLIPLGFVIVLLVELEFEIEFALLDTMLFMPLLPLLPGLLRDLRKIIETSCANYSMSLVIMNSAIFYLRLLLIYY